MNAREKARLRYAEKRAALMVELQFSKMTVNEFGRRMAELGKTAKKEAAQPEIPACPRCGAELTRIVCPPGMSIASFSFRRDGDWTCAPCAERKRLGTLHAKAKVSWYESRFRPPASPLHMGGRS